MNHQDHVRLLVKGILAQGGVWADFGSGTGAFTLALADLIGPEGQIYSIDKNVRSLREQERAMNARFADRDPGKTFYQQADFTLPLELPPLDGAVMANALHFEKEKEQIVRRLHSYLKPGGRFLLIEYNVDRGKAWVPYPLSYSTWETLAGRSGFNHTRLLETVPSRFLGQIYSALSFA